ncbi:hypothetical protein AXY37_06105 [Mammaliicoccus lentus]|uniref:DUF488 domain-containing protein n=1 Tax=Mammaliicoccus lentus TaxID=42858 RepID=UPI0002D80511|nr:DUF488 family protein [Mammaliicoccus lentus]MBF0749560.1 DUF488 family protein [Mammaliicoccus lentus]MEB5685184.1 DUF488 family protein [Mammaliicoccus lentus]OAO31449.1 hypothetical protein AXY37_06105 [Mammaliicoccus lentus]TFU57429.1 DUF488 family protein [Mammaliicoccus lentus]WQL56307.1 DUF488 family protein [Mammaliicoccus lentus]
MSCDINRIYEDYDKDNVRVLVDRVWPRGISKEKANLDHWIKEIAPSDSLRKWFGHDSEKFDSFKKKYKEELKSGEQKEALDQLKDIYKENNGNVVLLYGAKDEKHNQAVVLKEFLDHQ